MTLPFTGLASLFLGAALLATGLAACQPEAGAGESADTPPAGAQEQRPIIDMHLHANRPGRYPPEEPMTELTTPDSSEEVHEKTFAALERHNVVLAVTSGPELDSYEQSAPRRIVEGCLAGGSGESVDSLRKRIIRGDCGLLAEFSPQYAGVPPDDPSLEPYFALAESLDVPVGMHVGLGPPGVAYEDAPKYRMEDGNPLLLEDVLVRHPDLRLYVMHAGWPFLEEMMGLLHMHPQVYLDIAVINWVLPREEFHTYLRRLVEAGFGERIMYGSDQMVWPQSIERSIGAIRSAPFLTDEQKQDILYNNAARFLQLDEEEIARHHEMATQ